MEQRHYNFIAKKVKISHLLFIVLYQYCIAQTVIESKSVNKSLSDSSKTDREVPKLSEMLLHGAPMVDHQLSNASFNSVISKSVDDPQIVQRRNEGSRNLMSDNLQPGVTRSSKNYEISSTDTLKDLDENEEEENNSDDEFYDAKTYDGGKESIDDMKESTEYQAPESDDDYTDEGVNDDDNDEEADYDEDEEGDDWYNPDVGDEVAPLEEEDEGEHGPLAVEAAVDQELVKKNKPPTGPSSMVIFYTWMIVAVLVIVIALSTYQTRLKANSGKNPFSLCKTSSQPDKKRLLNHEFA